MKRIFIPFILVIVWLALLPTGLWCNVFEVSNSTQLQNALTTAATNGEDDIIKVAQGTYIGEFIYSSNVGYSISVLGGYTSGFASRVINPANTILDANGSGTALSLGQHGGGDVKAEGLTLQNGGRRGIWVRARNTSGPAGSITLTSNIIQGVQGRGGVYITSEAGSYIPGDIILSNNMIVGNSNTEARAGGLSLDAIWIDYSADIVLVNNIIVENTSPGAGGVFMNPSFNTDIILTNNTITGNHGSGTGPGGNAGGVQINHPGWMGSTAYLYNNIIRGNTVDSGAADIKFYSGSSSIGLNNNYSDMAGTWTISAGNINSNPLFVDAANQDYRLQSDSPCIDAGTNSASYLPEYDFYGDVRIIYGEFDGNMSVDIGADEFLQLPTFDGHDFDGDGTSDISVWRPSSGNWFIQGGFTLNWGIEGDISVNGNYNGDSTTDIAIWRPSDGTWYIRNIATYAWGTIGDIPVPGDYNGDGITDMAVWRPSDGTWYIRDIATYAWGTIGDIPVPGDYNGDGTTDMAVWRPSDGTWYIRNIATYAWGTNGDIPVPGDYNGDGTTDVAVWRSSDGIWYLRNIATYPWGTTGDIPVPGDYNGDGTTDVAVWRPSYGGWYIRNIGVYFWGTSGDIPLVR